MKTYRVIVDADFDDIEASDPLTALRMYINENNVACDSRHHNIKVLDLGTHEVFKPKGNAYPTGRMSQFWSL